LSNTGFEQIVVLENQLNIVNWKVDQHTGDLGRLGSDQLGNEFVEDGSNLVLVVRVVGNNSWEDDIGCHDKLLVDGQLLLRSCLLLNLLVHLLHLRHLLLCGRLLLHHWVLLLHSIWLLLVHHAGSLTSSLSLILSVVTSSLLLVITWATWTSVLVVVWSSVLVVWSLAHGSLRLLLLHEHWHALDEKLEVVLELFLVSKICPFCTL